MASNELTLLENVELKFAMANTDEQLQRAVQMFLTPVLLKLSSPHQEVRQKVMTILSHINKRVKSNSSIALPFDGLLAQFLNDNVTAFVKNFTVMYLEMSVERMSPEETAKYIPQFLSRISQRPAAQRTMVFHIILPVLRKWTLEQAKQKEARSSIFQFDQYPQDAKVTLDFFLNVMLYQPPTARTLSQMEEDGEAPVCPGLSEAGIEAVTNKGKVKWSPARLAEVKLGILHFTMSHIFTDTERLPILISGACDGNHEIVSKSEDGLRRWTTTIDLENPQLIQSLYTLYLGTKPTAAGGGKDGKTPAPNPVKIRVLQFLNKSILATNMVAQMIQVVFDGLYGETSTLKLRRSTMTFLQWTARMCDSAKIAPVAPVLVSGLLKYIDQTGPVSGHDTESIKGAAYVGCGLIAKKVPKVALNDTQMLELFFESLETEQPNIRVYVQDALSSMIEVYTDLPEDAPVYATLQGIILSSVEKPNSYSRYMALKYANAVYPFSSIFARYVCLLGTSATVTKLEVKEEATRGLQPFVRSSNGLLSSTQTRIPVSALPRFADLVKYLSEHKPSEPYVYASKTPIVKGYPIEVYSEMLRFLRMIFVLEANPTTIVIDDYVESKVENGMSEDPAVMDGFKTLIHAWWGGDDPEKREAIQTWLQFIENALDQNLKDPVLLVTAAQSLLEIISLGPSSIATTFKSNLDFFKAFTMSPKQDTRTLMSHIFGLIASDTSIENAQVEAILSEYCTILEDPSSINHTSGDVERRHGALLTIGYLMGRCYYRGRSLSEHFAQRCTVAVAGYLDDTPTATAHLLSAAACQALGEIGRIKPLSLPTESDGGDGASSKDGMDIDKVPTSKNVFQRLAKLAKSSKEPKVQERAILTLGQLSIPLTKTDTLLNLVTDALYTSADTKQVELFFAGGEAWSMVAFGWESQAMQKHKDISDTTAMDLLNQSEEHKNKMGAFQTIIEKIVSAYVGSDRSWYRKAACIWLLSILKFGKNQPLVRTNLGILHASFSRLLADRDDFTQEVASKGLGLVYEYGDAKIKEDMLFSLVGTFTEGRTIQAQSVTDNTVLFEEGALGTTPDGSSITTYKELCSLASELNQPDLIYKFMNLANHNAMWTSRRGAAFGFQNLMAIAEKELEPYLPRLIPKLYRYQFDPNPRVNQSMKAIWQSLVKDNQKTVDKYFNEIMEDVLASLGNRQWRVREAACAAVTDLVQGRQLAQIEPYLERLWTMCFRTLDDIKDSVRRAATQTCKSLTKLTVHYCDPTVVSPSDGAKVMNIVMPFLLQKGLVSDAEDVRKFSLDALLRVCKTGASLLKAYIPELVDSLLQSLSSMEPQAMNYLSFHVDKYNISQEQLDNARLSGAKNSPMMEGIEHCVNQIDQDVMQELAPRIIHIIKKGTGLPTKAGCARFIVTLCMNRRVAFEPYADTFLKTLSGAIRSKNPVIRKSFATATGYVCQLASYDRLVALVNHLKKLYIEDTDEDAHAASAVTTVEITRFATDRVKAIATEIVPLIYFGEHDPDKDISKLWTAAWENLTSGTRSMVALHTDEIIAFVQPLLSSPSWAAKQTAALTIADMCKSSGKAISAHIDKLMPVMVSTLASRSWSGKEHVLDAFVQLCVSSPQYFETPGKELSLTEAVKILIREAKRKNTAYRRHALASLKTFSETFSTRIDIYDPVNEFLIDLCEMDENDAMEEDDHDDAKPLLLAIKANAFKCLAAVFQPKFFASQAKETEPLCKVFVDKLPNNVWNVQLAILESIKVFIEQATPESINDTLVATILSSCVQHGLGNLKYSMIRTAAIDVLETVVAQPAFIHVSDSTKQLFREHVQAQSDKEPLPLLKNRLQTLLRSLA